MYFIFSGEGATDLGQVFYEGKYREGKTFDYGPLVYLVDYLVKEKHQYSIIESQNLEYVTKNQLKSQNIRLYAPKGEMREYRETGFFFQAARRLALFAKNKAKERNDNVVAILFRDTDTRNSSERGEWEKKRKSMLDGFSVEKFDKGVAMIPKPVSEAWFLCAIYRKRNPNDNCDYLENETFGTGSDHQLKSVLKKIMDGIPTIELLNEGIVSGDIDFHYLGLPSFNQFKERLREVM